MTKENTNYYKTIMGESRIAPTHRQNTNKNKISMVVEGGGFAHTEALERTHQART